MSTPAPALPAVLTPPHLIGTPRPQPPLSVLLLTHYPPSDIGSNLSDPVFRGVYRGKRAHDDDWLAIVARARTAGVIGQILTGDCLAGSKESLELAKDQGAPSM